MKMSQPQPIVFLLSLVENYVCSTVFFVYPPNGCQAETARKQSFESYIGENILGPFLDLKPSGGTCQYFEWGVVDLSVPL